MPPLTALQLTTIFEDAEYLALTNRTRLKLVEEGIERPEDLAQFDSKAMEQIRKSLLHPAGRVVDPEDEDRTIPTPPFVIGAKSLQRMMAMADLVRFYQTIGRELTIGNLRCSTIAEHFSKEWSCLTEKRKATPGDVPRYTKDMGILRWLEAFNTFLSFTIGTRNIPLSYVVRANVVPQEELPRLEDGRPYSRGSINIHNDLIEFATHEDARFSEDNRMVYGFLEEATRTSSYASMLKQFQDVKNGRGAYLAIKSQYAGPEVWEAQFKKCSDFMTQKKWKGNGTFPLSSFLNQHRMAYSSMWECANKIEIQLPNERMRIQYVLNAIETSDNRLLAALGHIQANRDTNPRFGEFDYIATYLIPNDPVEEKQGKLRRNPADIAALDQGPPKKLKNGTGMTGVELRYHKRDEWQALSDAQRQELREWRKRQGQGQGSSRNQNHQSQQGRGPSRGRTYRGRGRGRFTPRNNSGGRQGRGGEPRNASVSALSADPAS